MRNSIIETHNVEVVSKKGVTSKLVTVKWISGLLRDTSYTTRCSYDRAHRDNTLGKSQSPRLIEYKDLNIYAVKNKRDRLAINELLVEARLFLHNHSVLRLFYKDRIYVETQERKRERER